MSKVSELEALIKSAERSIARGDFDAAEAGIDYANSVIRKAKQAQSSNDDEAEDDYDDPSNPSADAADNDDDDGADDDDDDGEDLDKLLKATVPERTYVHSTSQSSSRMRRQHTREQQPETYRLSAEVPAQGPGKQSKFEALVDHVAQRDNVPKHIAMQTARHQYPQSYTTYQRQLSDRSSRRQAMARGYHLMAAKSAASTTYEDLVSEQIAKGCSPELAAQRVVQLHGNRALDTRMFTKTAEDITKRFQREVEKIMYEDGCDATEATRLARIENPLLFKAMQII
jgi:hypothetical protein